MIQIISLQRTGGSSLFLSIAYTYNYPWINCSYEPDDKIRNKFDNREIENKTIKDIASRKNVKATDLCNKIQNSILAIRLSAFESIEENDVNLIIEYFKEIQKKSIDIQKTFGLATSTSYFIEKNIHPVFCSRYLDQYLLSHINLKLNPVFILNEYPGILKYHYDLQDILGEIRKIPIFSYNMEETDQYPACARWLIHSYYCLKYQKQYNIPMVWTGDNSTKGIQLCDYIRNILGKESGNFGILEDNLLKKHVVPKGSEFFNESQEGRWHFWPKNNFAFDINIVKKYIDPIFNLLSKSNNQIYQELSQRIYSDKNE